MTAYARRCVAAIGPALRFYTTPVAVDDVDQVRQALGYDKINLYGISYGPTMEQVYLRRYGSHVRTAVMDSGSLLDMHIFEQQGPNAQRALDLLVARCASDAACHAAFPAVRQDVARVMARLAQGPLSVTLLSFEQTVKSLLVDSRGAATLPRLLHHAARGDFAPLAQVILSGDPAQVLAYYYLSQCSEPWAVLRPAEVNRESAGSFYREALLLDAQVTQAVCRVFPRGVVPADLGQRVRSTVSVLLLNGGADPQDPPANVADARRELPNSLTVIVPGQGHDQLGHDASGCIASLIARFIAAGTARGLDTSCAQRIPLATFDTSS